MTCKPWPSDDHGPRVRPGRRTVACSRGARPLVENLEGRRLLSTFTVTNTGDDGPGSLRSAILLANADVDPSGTTIRFDLPPDDPNHLYYKSDGVSGTVSPFDQDGQPLI